ncbi:MAG: hypothetical protein LBD61_06155 [Endomicrobium sp.]|jgi:hypothetical protein|nr:hypothetical protein [Endomicrobium sp.]
MNKGKIPVVFLIHIFILISSKAFPKAAGTTVFDFLKLPKNAIQASLASMSSFGTNTSMPNPAVLGLVDKYNIQATHASHVQGVSYNTVYLSALVKKTVLSIMYDGIDYGKIERTKESPDGDYIKEDTFSAEDSCVQINSAQKISKDIYAGAGIKYTSQSIDGSSISGMAIDLAALYSSNKQWFLTGGLENVGLKVGKYNLPGNVYISYKNSLDESFDIGFELKTFFDGIVQLKGAFEINRDQMFFLRVGYSYPINNNNSHLGEWYKRNLSFGFGINIKKTVSIDYAWLPYGELGNMSIFSLRVEFK